MLISLCVFCIGWVIGYCNRIDDECKGNTDYKYEQDEAVKQCNKILNGENY